MIAGLDKKDDAPTGTLGSLRRRIAGGGGAPKPPVVLQAPPRVDGDEPVNEWDMEAVCNFRDVLAAAPSPLGPLRPRLFFRSATLDAATAADAEKIAGEIGVRTIIDLRSKSEGTPNPLLHPRYRTLRDPAEIDGYLAAARSRASEGNGAANGEKPERLVFRLDYLDQPTRAMFSWLYWWQKIVFLLLLVFWSRQAAIKYFVTRTMSRMEGGLAKLNEEVLEKSGKEVRRMLEIMSLPERHPVLFHCSAGKDRTGLTAAILLSLVGASDDYIVADYHRSERELASVVDFLESEVQKQGLSTEWAHVPEHIMRHTLSHIRERYGSLSSYLSSISFPLAAQERLASLMVVPEAERGKKHARRTSKGILPVVDKNKIGVGIPGNVGVGEALEEIIDPHED
ncbi:protein-tyrosine phosphatase-like protein [Hyaloraphidium curvatum]|nr:protein-tyrosine phosphatase-like protein [Hyaloraphidium curvatum]